MTCVAAAQIMDINVVSFGSPDHKFSEVNGGQRPGVCSRSASSLDKLVGILRPSWVLCLLEKPVRSHGDRGTEDVTWNRNQVRLGCVGQLQKLALLQKRREGIWKVGEEGFCNPLSTSEGR